MIPTSRRPTTFILISFRCTSHAIALTNRPLECDETFTLEITRINPEVSGYLSFGVTEHRSVHILEVTIIFRLIQPQKKM